MMTASLHAVVAARSKAVMLAEKGVASSMVGADMAAAKAQGGEATVECRIAAALGCMTGAHVGALTEAEAESMTRGVVTMIAGGAILVEALGHDQRGRVPMHMLPEACRTAAIF